MNLIRNMSNIFCIQAILPKLFQPEEHFLLWEKIISVDKSFFLQAAKCFLPETKYIKYAPNSVGYQLYTSKPKYSHSLPSFFLLKITTITVSIH